MRLEKIVGQTVAHVQAYEYGVILTFADGTKLEFNGTTYGDGPLVWNSLLRILLNKLADSI